MVDPTVQTSTGDLCAPTGPKPHAKSVNPIQNPGLGCALGAGVAIGGQVIQPSKPMQLSGKKRGGRFVVPYRILTNVHHMAGEHNFS